MMAFKHHITSFFLAALSLAAAAPAYAQSTARPVEDLARQSEIIAVGKVAATTSEWDRSNDRIVTNVTVNVGEYLKGNAGNVVTITAMGGEVNGVGEWYSHTASFKKDEDVVVFARRDPGGRFRVAGGDAGKVKIDRDPKSGSAIVHGNKSLAEFKREISAAMQSREAK